LSFSNPRISQTELFSPVISERLKSDRTNQELGFPMNEGELHLFSVFLDLICDQESDEQKNFSIPWANNGWER
jgi:hypothetical protein